MKKTCTTSTLKRGQKYKLTKVLKNVTESTVVEAETEGFEDGTEEI